MRRALVLVERLFQGAACVLMFGLVAITFTDVIGRQFGNPLPAAFELTELCVGAMFFIALPFVTYHREHVTVDLIPFDENGPVGRWIGFGVDLLCAFLVGYAALQLWGQAETLGMFRTTTMFLKVPLSPVVLTMAALTAFTAVLCCALAVLRLRENIRGAA